MTLEILLNLQKISQSYVGDVNSNVSQSCKMSILLHRAKPSSQILPEEKRVNREWGAKIDKRDTFGEQMLMILSNYESLDRDISHRLCKSLPKKASFCKIVCSPRLSPQLAKKSIRHIHYITYTILN